MRKVFLLSKLLQQFIFKSAFGVLFIVFSNTTNIAQTLQTQLPVTNGQVNAMLQVGDTLYIGGRFTNIGEATGKAILLDKNTAKHDKNFPAVAVDGWIYVSVPDGNGGWYIGGHFSLVKGGVIRNSIVHINADNSISPWDPNITYTNTHGVIIPGDVYSIVLKDSVVYIGGWFDSVSGIERSNAAAVTMDDDAKLTAWKPQPNSAVTTIVPSDSTMFIGGWFTKLLDNIATRLYIAEVKADNGYPTLWNPNIEGQNGADPIHRMQLVNDTLFILGNFVSVNAVRRFDLASIDAKTGEVTDWDPLAYANSYQNLSKEAVYDFKVVGDTVFLAGTFRKMMNFKTGTAVDRNLLAAVSKSVSTTPYGILPTLYDWAPSIEGNELPISNTEVAVYSISIEGNKLYAAGTFNEAGNVEHQNIAAFDINTGEVTDFNPHIASAAGTYLPGLYNVYAYKNKVMTGGFINIANAVYRNGAAAIKISTGEILPWDPKFLPPDPRYPFSVVGHMLMYQNNIFMSGYFSYMDADTVKSGNALVIADPDSGKVSSFYVHTINIGSMKIYDNKLFVSGGFDTFGDSTRYGLASYDLINHKITNWNPNNLLKYKSYYNSINAIAIHDSTVYLGGSFSYVGDKQRVTLGAVNAFTGKVLDWDPSNSNIDAKIRSVYYADGKVFVGGGFTRINGKNNRSYLAAVDPKTGEILPWVTPEIKSFRSSGDGIPGLFSISSMDSILFIGGAISGIGNNYSINGVAAFNIHNGDVLTDFQAKFGYLAQVGSIVNAIHPVPSHNTIYFGGNFQFVNGAPYSGFAAFGDVITGVQENNQPNIPFRYSLSQNYPNPFNPSTNIQYFLPKSGFVKLAVYDILGREVSTLINKKQIAGKHEVTFDAGNLASGLYIYRLTTGGYSQSKKMMLLK